MNIVIREFRPGDEAAFRELNEAWITAYFTLEPKDSELLNHPQQQILDKGGFIYFAEDADSTQIVGCCALLAMGDATFEAGKMAVAENLRGRGIGRKMLQGVVNAARVLGARRLYLETNDSLRNAIALYLSKGFEYIPLEDIKPSPLARANVYMQQAL